jgi:DDE superfamily endonuclease
MALLDAVDAEVEEHIRTIHLVGDPVRTHHGQEVQHWLAHHARLVMHVTPVHGSWMNHVEQWCSILPRKRLRMVDVASQDQLCAKLDQCIREWHHHAHPFNWSTRSVPKIMAAAPALAA